MSLCSRRGRPEQARRILERLRGTPQVDAGEVAGARGGQLLRSLGALPSCF